MADGRNQTKPEPKERNSRESPPADSTRDRTLGIGMTILIDQTRYLSFIQPRV